MSVLGLTRQQTHIPSLVVLVNWISLKMVPWLAASFSGTSGCVQFKFLLKNFSSAAFRLVHALLAAFTASGAINFQIQHQAAPQPRSDFASLFLHNLIFSVVLISSGTMRLSLAFDRAELGIWNLSNTSVYTFALSWSRHFAKVW